MYISLEKKILADAVHIASRFSQRKSTQLASLSSILIIAGDDGIKLRATNLEIGADLKVAGAVKSAGVTAIPATVFEQVAASLIGEGKVTLEQAGDLLTIVSGNGKSSIRTVPYDDFPSIPFPESSKNRFVIGGKALTSLLASIAPCASTSTVRPELASIYLSISSNTLTAAATDSFRLAEKKIALTNAPKGMQSSILLPAKNALDIAQVIPDEDIIISFDEHQCVFVSSIGMLVSRLTNATYPDYHQIIPKESVAEATVLQQDLEAALKRTTIFSDSFQKVKLSFDPKKKLLSLSARNADIGESNETVPAQIAGTAIELSFNHRYLAALFPLTSSESISLSAAGVGRPLIARGTGDSSLTYLVSPMNQ